MFDSDITEYIGLDDEFGLGGDYQQKRELRSRWYNMEQKICNVAEIFLAEQKRIELSSDHGMFRPRDYVEILTKYVKYKNLIVKPRSYNLNLNIVNDLIVKLLDLLHSYNVIKSDSLRYFVKCEIVKLRLLIIENQDPEELKSISRFLKEYENTLSNREIYLYLVEVFLLQYMVVNHLNNRFSYETSCESRTLLDKAYRLIDNTTYYLREADVYNAFKNQERRIKRHLHIMVI